jgi:hypothetical protein
MQHPIHGGVPSFVHAEGLGIDIVHDKEFLFLFHTEDIG